jgi:CBS domain-containing protein
VPQPVNEVMTPRPVALPLDASVVEAARLMRDQGIGDVLVTSEGMLVGVVTDRDIVVRALADGGEPRGTTVGEVCTADLISIRPEEDVENALRLMRAHAVRRLPVVDGGRPVGIVTLGDLALEADVGTPLAEISKAPPNS